MCDQNTRWLVVINFHEIILGLELYHFSRAPPGTHTVIFYKIVNNWLESRQAGWQAGVYCVKTLETGVMKHQTPHRVMFVTRTPHTNQPHQTLNTASSTPHPHELSRHDGVMTNTTGVGSCEAEKLQYMHAWSPAPGSAVLYYWDNLRRGIIHYHILIVI